VDYVLFRWIFNSFLTNLKEKKITRGQERRTTTFSSVKRTTCSIFALIHIEERKNQSF
jgi:hypothetical protein